MGSVVATAVASRIVVSGWTEVAPSPSPTAPTDEDTEAGVQIAMEDLLRKFGFDPDNLPTLDLPSSNLILAIILLAASVLLLRAIYRGMQRPRLNLTYHDDRPPTADTRSVLRYCVTPLVWLPMWFSVVLFILMLAANRTNGFRPADQLVVAAAAVVGGSRLLAHLNLEGAHELAKSVPLTLLSLILISGQTITLEGFAVLSLLLLYSFNALAFYVLLLGVLDAIVTTLWWLAKRAEWTRSQRPPEEVDQRSRRRRLWQLVVDSWGARESGPSEAHEVASPEPEASAHRSVVEPPAT